MLQAITTKWLGPTNHRGSRIVARCDAKRIVVEWNYALGIADNHADAAYALAKKLKWTGSWHGGSTVGSGFCFVCVDAVNQEASFLVEHDASYYVDRIVANDERMGRHTP